MTGYPPRLMLSACFQKSPVGVLAPGALRSVSVVVLVGTASLTGLRLLEDDFDGERPVTGYPPRLMLSASLPEIACGGTRSRCALVPVGCLSDQGDFVEGPAPFGRRLRQRAPRNRVPSSAHAVRFASRAPVGVPAPGALWFVSGVALVGTASLTGLRLWEDNSTRHIL